VTVIACGALGAHLREITARRQWPVELHTLPAPLHNHPREIAPWAERLAAEAIARGQRVAVAYADCGTYGALDDVCARLGLRRLPGLHCYDVFAGPDRDIKRVASRSDVSIFGSAASFAAKRSRRRTGNGVRIRKSRRSGNSMSHSKSVAKPTAANE